MHASRWRCLRWHPPVSAPVGLRRGRLCSRPATQRKKSLNTAFIRRAQGCKARALAGSLALARAPAVPYLADGACKTHPVMLSHGAAEDL